MGWMWSSGSAPKGSTSDSSTTSTTQNQSVPSKAREPEYADPEIAKFMAQIQAEFGGGSNSSSSSHTTSGRQQSVPEQKTGTIPPAPSKAPSSSSSWWSFWGSSTSTSSTSTQPSPPSQDQSSARTVSSSFEPTATNPPNPDAPQRLDPLSESLLPTTMSCRQAFDHAFHCNSVGGQWTAVYRAGSVRSCSEQWDDFWFCMRTRAYSGAVKEEAIRDHYRRRELARYGPGMPNSTDVWEPRSERLPAGEAFRERYEKPDISDEEWRRLEIERRRMVQRMLREEQEGAVAS
ncbi:hypothetical protein F5Y19DRAFT_37283 [Xylariaceae sp. FL1651]|nr:hypothetical protein F5Y19DRAFT_37283 [Xylariaceae sp. FL1651]